MVAERKRDEEDGVFLLLLSLICLGTWPALLRLCTYNASSSSSSSSSSVEEEEETSTNTNTGNHQRNCVRRLADRCSQCRHPCHAYIDYAAAYVVFSSTVPILLSYFIGSDYDNGDDRSESNVMNDNDADVEISSSNNSWDATLKMLPLILTASAGGSLLSLGNISTQWSTTIYASPLTTVLALQASLTVVLGTTINYFLEPSKTARPDRLASGVAFFMVAIGLSVASHTMYSYDKKKNGSERGIASRIVGGAAGATSMSSDIGETDDAGISMRDLVRPTTTITMAHYPGSLDYCACSNYDDEVSRSISCSSLKGERAQSLSDKARGHNNMQSVDAFVDDECYPHTSSPLHIERTVVPIHTAAAVPNVSTMGLGVAFCGGLCFGFFSPAINIAVNNPFHWDGESGKNGGDSTGLSVAEANFWFSVAFAATSVLWNVYLMHSPPSSAPNVPRSTMQLYISVASRDRTLALLAGMICATGNVLQFQGGRLCGYAASDLVQAFPLVGTMWDVVVFGEFHAARRIVVLCLSCMYLVYLGGIILMASSIAI